MSGFKQAVDEILKELVGVNCNCTYCANERKHYTDRILAVHNKRLDEIAEGMPKPVGKSSSLAHISEMLTMDKQRRTDQTHIRASKEG